MPVPSRTSVIVPLIVGCAQFMHQFDGAMITTALPAMAASLHEDPLVLNLAVTCYLLALAVFVPISGWTADRYGARRVFLAAIALFTVSSVLCGLSTSLVEIVIWRTLQGIGGAMMTPVGRVIVVKSVARHEIVQAMNYITIPAVLAPLTAPTVAGFIVTYFSWPWIFFVNLPIGLAGLLLVYVYVPDVREEEAGPLDLRGFVLIGLAMAGLVFGFAALGRGPLPSAVIVLSIGVGSICGTLYLAHARRSRNPIIELRLLRNRTFAAAIFGGSLFYITTTSHLFLMALLLQVGLGFPAFHAGLILLAGAAGSTLMRFTFRQVLTATGFRRLLVWNGLFGAALFAACGLFAETTPLILILATLFAAGYSRSTQFSAVQTLGYAEIPSAEMSRATSFASMIQQVVQSFGVGLSALVVHVSTVLHGRTQIETGDVALSFFAIGLLSSLSVLIFLRLPPSAGSELTAP
ncbi:MAG: MFS transporter [Hyphomicrobiales bacterium]|nr:MFS transporter [Hyphomicrobiales bacterium]